MNGRPMPKISGRDAASKRLRALSGKEKVELVGRALFVGGEMIDAEASRLITEGAVSGKNHVPSKPGEPPNEDTGLLRSRIEVNQVAPLRVQVSSNAPYAVELEFGTSKMAERPYMRPATKRKRKEVVALVRRAVSIATRRKP
jgi:HK97 gp10 family phage protein